MEFLYEQQSLLDEGVIYVPEPDWWWFRGCLLFELLHVHTDCPLSEKPWSPQQRHVSVCKSCLFPRNTSSYLIFVLAQ